MAPLLLHTSRCLAGTAHGSDARDKKGIAKGLLLGMFRDKAHAVTLFGSPSSALHPWSHHASAISANDGPSAEVDIITAASTGSEATAAAGPGSQQDADAGWEAVRLMTAAKILSSASSTDSDDAAYGIDDDSTSLDDSTAASAQLDLTDLGPMAVLDEIQTLAADSLSLAVGILRQNDADEAGVQLSERLRDFLMVLHKRPISTNSTAAASQHSTGAVGEQAGAAAAVDHADDGFWAGQDEWCDVRAALMEVGINASLDEDDDDAEEDVWALEAGRVKTRRTRLLRSLPKLDSSTAQQLAAFLSEAHQHSSTAAATGGHQVDNSPSAAAAAAQEAAAPVSEEEQQWWQQASLAYSLLKQQAGKVQQGQEQQELDSQQA